MANNKEYELAIKIAGQVERSFLSATKMTKQQFDDVSKEAAQASSKIKRSFSQSLSDCGPMFNKMSSLGREAFNAIKKSAVVATTAIAGVSAASIKVGSDFESQMSTVKSISGASGQEFDTLVEKAKEVGRTSKYTATEVGEAMEYMAMAGWDSAKITEGIASTMDLAAASGEDLATVSDIVTDSMTAFKEEITSDNINKFNDTLAATASSANTNVSMLGESFKYVAPLAGSLNYSIEDTSLALGTMANSGIKASQAGTSLRSLLKRLSAPTKQSAEAMEALGLSMTDSEGNMKSLGQLLNETRKAFSGLTEDQKAQYASMLSGSTGMSGLLSIVNTSSADYKKLAKSIRDSSGAAKEMAEIKMDNLEGDVTKAQSALEGLGIDFYENIKGPLREAVQWFTNAVGDFSKSEFFQSIGTKIPTAARKVKEFAKSINELAKPLLNIGGWLVDHPNVIVGTLIGIGSAIATYKVASGITSVVTALTSLGPAGTVILGLGAVAGIVTGIGSAIKQAREDAKNANLADHLGDIALSMEELQGAADAIVNTKSLVKVKNALGQFDELDSIGSTISDITDSINKKNWKVSIGIDLTEDEQEEYKEEISNFIKECNSYTEQEQYSVKLAIKATLGNNDTISDSYDDFYRGQKKKMEELGQNLQNYVNTAFNDGLLSIDESKTIAKLQRQMSEIQNAMSEAEIEANMSQLSIEADKVVKTGLNAESLENFQQVLADSTSEARQSYKDAYTQALTAAIAKREESGDKNAQEIFEKEAEALKSGYLNNVRKLETDTGSVLTDTIKSAYEKELKKASNYFSQRLEVASGESANDKIQSIRDMINMNGLDQATKDALAELNEGIKSERDALQATVDQLEETGQKVPKKTQELLDTYNLIGAAAGEQDSIWEVIKAKTDSEDYNELLKSAQKIGEDVPESVGNAITDNVSDALDGVTKLRDEIKKKIEEDMDVEIKTNVKYSVSSTSHLMSYVDMYNTRKIKGESSGGITVDKRATGGLITKKELSWIGEEGPEMIIPLDGSENAKNLYRQTGDMLGMDTIGAESARLNNAISNSTSNESISIEFKPTLNFHGSVTSGAEVQGALDNALEKFDQLMQQWMRQNKRLSFS